MRVQNLREGYESGRQTMSKMAYLARTTERDLARDRLLSFLKKVLDHPHIGSRPDIQADAQQGLAYLQRNHLFRPRQGWFGRVRAMWRALNDPSFSYKCVALPPDCPPEQPVSSSTLGGAQRRAIGAFFDAPKPMRPPPKPED